MRMGRTTFVAAVVAVLVLASLAPGTARDVPRAGKINAKRPSEMVLHRVELGHGVQIAATATDRYPPSGQMSASPRVCVRAEQVHPIAPGWRKIERHEACAQPPHAHDADAVRWKGHVVVDVVGDKSEIYQHFDGSSWRDVHVHEAGFSHIFADLHWTGHGLLEPHVQTYGLPLTCYAFPPICTQVMAWARRDANVAGTVRLAALGASFDVAGRAGTIAFHA